MKFNQDSFINGHNSVPSNHVSYYGLRSTCITIIHDVSAATFTRLVDKKVMKLVTLFPSLFANLMSFWGRSGGEDMDRGLVVVVLRFSVVEAREKFFSSLMVFF